MIIHAMRACFGKLEDRELLLQPGLNVISGDNEAGKSTWIAFLLAMFYGIDTRDRGKAGHLPDKLRFRPWSGKPMAGTLVLSDGDRTLTLERGSQTGPMQDFRAWDAAGTPAEDLTGKSCGQTLLGVEAAVYTRSGLLRQQRLPVSADPQLEKRLSSLVTAGSEDYAYAELDGKLKKLQNALRSPQGGALPRAEAARRAAERRLAEIAEQRSSLIGLETEIRSLRARREELREILAGLDALDRSENRTRVRAAEEALRRAEEDRIAWETVCADLPEEAVLRDLEARLKQLQTDLERAALSEDPTAEAEEPESDPVFGFLGPREVHDKTAEDVGLVRRAQKTPRPGRKRSLLQALSLLAGLGLGIFGALKPLLPLLIAGGLLALAGLVWGLLLELGFRRRLRAYNALQQEAEDLLDEYEVSSVKEMQARGAARVRELEEQASSGGTGLRRELSELADRRQEIYARIEAMMPGCGTPEKAAALFQEAAQSRQELARARLLEAERRRQLRELRPVPDSDPEPDAELARFAGYDRETEQARLESLEQSLAEAVSRADKLAGAIGQMGDPLALEAEKERLSGEIRRMEERCAAIFLARKALEEADAALRARFAPLLCEKTGALFARLTEGRYDAVQLDRSLRVTVHPADSSVFRPLSYLSGGAVDQLYLALRLAICELLLPGKPIVLDDALAFFDDRRAALALELLKELSETRQILLFTCQSREKRILDELAQKRKAKASAQTDTVS